MADAFEWGNLTLDFTNEKGQRCRCTANTGSLCHIFNFDTNEYYTAENREIERFMLKKPEIVKKTVKETKIIQPTLF
jgi:hypothetical protein